MARSLTQITDFSANEIHEIFDLCKKMKSGEISPKPFEGKSVACIFTKESLRTRVSFEVGIAELGGHPVYITDKEIKLGQRETVADAAKVLSRYVATIMIRTFKQSDVDELAEHASVPVVNGLTDLVHPCQIMGDYFTMLEHLEPKERYSVAYVGDGNNITNSWLNLASRIPLERAMLHDELDAFADWILRGELTGQRVVNHHRDRLDRVLVEAEARCLRRGSVHVHDVAYQRGRNAELLEHPTAR